MTTPADLRLKLVHALSSIADLKRTYPRLTSPVDEFPCAMIRRTKSDWDENINRETMEVNWEVIVLYGKMGTLSDAINKIDSFVSEEGNSTSSIKYALEHYPYSLWYPDANYCRVISNTGEEGFELDGVTYLATRFQILTH